MLHIGSEIGSAFCFISVLTKDEKGLECVKHALNIGYSEKKIKQALLKLRVKGTETQLLSELVYSN